MMNKRSRAKELCRNFCSYYKPSNNKEPGCLGFTIAEKLASKNKNISFKKRLKKPVAESIRLISRNICPECPYYEDDCDFAAGKKGSPACGGLILLGHLLDEDIIDIDDMRNML